MIKLYSPGRREEISTFKGKTVEGYQVISPEKNNLCE
jgi:hypothetical protein